MDLAHQIIQAVLRNWAVMKDRSYDFKATAWTLSMLGASCPSRKICLEEALGRFQMPTSRVSF